MQLAQCTTLPRETTVGNNYYLYLMERLLNNTSSKSEDLWMSLKSAMLEACKLFVPKVKDSSYQYPKWFSPEIKHHLNSFRSLRWSIKKLYTETKANKLTSLEFKSQALMTTAKEMYGAKLTAAFSHKPKDLYRHQHHL